MTVLSEQQWNGRRMLLCTGDVEHIAPLPHVRDVYGIDGDLRCTCGAPIVLVDVLVIDRAPTLGRIADDRGAPLYTTAKLLPIAMLGTRS